MKTILEHPGHPEEHNNQMRCSSCGCIWWLLERQRRCGACNGDSFEGKFVCFIISCISFIVDQVTWRTLLFDHVCDIP